MGEWRSDQVVGLRNEIQSESLSPSPAGQGEAKWPSLEVEGPGVGGMGGLGGVMVLVEVVGSDEPSEAWQVSPLLYESTPPPSSLPGMEPTSRTASAGPPRHELIRQASQPLDGAKTEASEPGLRMALRPRPQPSSQVKGKRPVLEAAASGIAAGVSGGNSPPSPPPPLP